MDPSPIHVLHVDDDPEFRDLTATYLERKNDRFLVDSAASPAESLDTLSDQPTDCIVSDYDMPRQTGIEFLERVRERWPNLPFILFTGKGSEEVASEAISAGVTDYLHKKTGTEQYDLLANRIENAVQARRDAKAAERRRDLMSSAELISSTGGWELNLDTEELRMTNGLKQLYGLGEDTALSLEETFDLYDADSQERIGDIIEEAAETGYAESDDLHFQRVDGEQRVAKGTAELVEHTDNGTILRGVVRDITDQRQRERQFQALVENSADVISIVDAAGRFQYQSPSVEHILGYDPEETVGHVALEYIHPEDSDAIRRWFEDDVTAEAPADPVECRVRHADGSWRWLELRGNNQLDNSAVKGYVINSRDITARKDRVRDLRELTSQYQALVNYFPNGGVFLFDENLEYVRAGGDELSEVGLSSADFAEETPFDLFPDEIAEETARYYRKTLRGERCTYRQEYQGEHYEIQTLPIRDEAGDVQYGMAVSRNITDELERNAELKRQNERLDQFASIIAHDLRNPLHLSDQWLELARGECNSPHLSEVADAHRRIDRLIEDLLTFARLGTEALDAGPVPVDGLLRDCWETVGNDTATLVVETDATVHADRDRLQQLFENLLLSALEHGGADTTVSISRLVDGLAIEDDGPGIPGDEREDIFEPGYSTTVDGTGFGLQIVKQIENAHGWEISAVDGDGGARFEITGIEFAE